MQISSASANPYRLTVQRASSPGGSAFADLISTAGKSEVASGPKLASASRSDAVATPNYQNMTAADFMERSSAMYQRGEIDFDTLGVVQVNAHMAAAEVGDSTPMDFTAKFKSLMDFETESGHRSSPLSGYKIYEKILSKITPQMSASLIG